MTWRRRGHRFQQALAGDLHARRRQRASPSPARRWATSAGSRCTASKDAGARCQGRRPRLRDRELPVRRHLPAARATAGAEGDQARRPRRRRPGRNRPAPALLARADRRDQRHERRLRAARCIALIYDALLLAALLMVYTLVIVLDSRRRGHRAERRLRWYASIAPARSSWSRAYYVINWTAQRSDFGDARLASARRHRRRQAPDARARASARFALRLRGLGARRARRAVALHRSRASRACTTGSRGPRMVCA